VTDIRYREPKLPIQGQLSEAYTQLHTVAATLRRLGTAAARRVRKTKEYSLEFMRELRRGPGNRSYRVAASVDRLSLPEIQIVWSRECRMARVP
jgi:hypothetical protein